MKAIFTIKIKKEKGEEYISTDRKIAGIYPGHDEGGRELQDYEIICKFLNLDSKELPLNIAQGWGARIDGNTFSLVDKKKRDARFVWEVEELGGWVLDYINRLIKKGGMRK